MSMYPVVVALLLVMMTGAADARHPLEPVDTSSPRATMGSFLSLTQEAARRYHAYRGSPSPDTMDGLYQMRDSFGDVLDLSQVPPAAKGEVAVDTFVLLWEIMARLELPTPEQIPSMPTESEPPLDGRDQADADAKRPARWQLPGTEITIARVEEGSRKGGFLFSP